MSFKKIFKKLAVYCHIKDWYTVWKDDEEPKRRKWTVAIDVGLGLIVLMLALYYGNPGIYFIQYAELLVDNLRELLKTLKGCPIGLKLNVLLNDFFLDCFIYHVDLWWTFLIIVSPGIYYIFIPLTILGLFGLSFQLAMLSDLLILISLHAHCIYIYAATLYKMEIDGIEALCGIVLGRKRNTLKGRTESHNYMNRQLFLATLFFTVLLFLLPTILVYYVVFASLRFIIYTISYMLMSLRRKLLIESPLVTWIIAGNFGTGGGFDERTFDSTLMKSNIIKLKLSEKDSQAISLTNFFLRLVKGEVVKYVQPDEIIYNCS